MLKNYLLILLISMVPIIELRGAIPIGLGMGLPVLPTYLLCVLGNMIPVPFIYLFARKFLIWGYHKPLIGPICRFCINKGEKGGRALEAKAGKGMTVALLLAAFALVMTTYGAPARVALKIAKRNFKEYGSEVTATLCFYEDKVIVHNHQEDSEGDLRYEQILAVRQSPRLYLLELPGKTALLLEKTAFTKGALEEFPAFMRRKCPGRVTF